jgi:pimeloyl-ACP methyl ester carboxylesterase
MQSNPKGNGRSQSFPYPTRFAHVSDGPVAYFDEGAGDAIVFVHGLVGDFTHFEHVVPHFEDGHRVLGLDLPGCGLSCKPLSRHTVDGYARTVLDWMSGLGIQRATLVGHSAGGLVSAAAAMHAPHRVERLVLLSPAGLRRYSPPLRFLARTLIRPSLLHRTLERLAMPMLNQVFVTRNEHTEKFIRDALDRPTHPTLGEMAKVFHDLMPDLVSPMLLERAQELRMPILVVWGDSDRLVDRSAVDEVASVLPGTTFRKVAQCGHMPMIEKPAEVIETLRSFIQRTSRRAPYAISSSQQRASQATQLHAPPPPPSHERAVTEAQESSQAAA